jgi:predicted nucleic acid-binding protein
MIPGASPRDGAKKRVCAGARRADQGIQGANTDFLICALSERYEMPILTLDENFQLFHKHLPIKLHTPRARL